MTEFAGAAFRLSSRDKDGVPYRDILAGLVARSRNPAKRAAYEAELAVPPLPAEFAYLWAVFQRLRRRKGSNGFAAMPIEWPDLAAFQAQTGFNLAPWEVEIVEALDDLFLSPDNDKPKTETT